MPLENASLCPVSRVSFPCFFGALLPARRRRPSRRPFPPGKLTALSNFSVQNFFLCAGLSPVPGGCSMPSLRRLCVYFCLAGAAVLVSVSVVPAQIVTTTAGGYIGDGGSPLAAALAYPRFVVQDSSGNTFITDAENHRIREVSHGVITTFAGTGISGYSGDGGPAVLADLDSPYGLALDTAGNLYFSDILNQRVRKIDTGGFITTVAGKGTAGYNGDGIGATSASLNLPRGVVLDSTGIHDTADT